MTTLEEQLEHAVEHNNILTVSSLIKKARNINLSPLLCRAARLGHIESIKVLLDAGAEIDAGAKLHNTACYAAIAGRSFDALKLLCERGARIDNSALVVKAANCSLNSDDRSILLLLDAGAPIDNLTGEDLMDLVARPSSVAVLKRLMALSVDVCALRGPHDRTLCHYVIICADRFCDVDELIRALADVGVNVDDVDDFGATPLHFAANKSSARVLVELGADIDRQDDNAHTPLHRASDSRTLKVDGPCVPMLLALGANVHLVDTNGQTASHLAASEQHRANLCACLAAGGDKDHPDNNGDTVRTIARDNDLQLPTSDEIEDARRSIAKTRLDLVRQRAFQICVGVQSLRLNALELCEIMMYSFGALGSLIAFHQWWAIATTVKHFHDRKLLQ